MEQYCKAQLHTQNNVSVVLNTRLFNNKSVRPEVRGTTNFNGGAYPPSKTSPPYALTTLIIFRQGGAGRDRKYMLSGADTFNAVCGEGGVVCRGPRPTSSFDPQRELPSARLVIHCTDLCQL